jgi:phenylpropionate dioxygenase-like ring-hydroxylating dioxygenase large terminal subunit
MLSKEDNARLTKVGPGTPLGKFFRRYWVPAAKLEEIAEPGGSPARVGLFGEQLVAFRDPTGKPGLVHEFCPHRGASLAYGRVEEGGVRCLYHGWKIAQDGKVLETPPEPKGSKLAQHLCQVAYPVREAGGLLWTYMGPKELEPPFPNYPWLNLPASQLLVVKMYQDCNYLQGLEGDLDPAHPNYLHRDFELEKDKSWAGAGWQSIANLMTDGAPAIHCEETPYLMRVAAIRKTQDAKVNYVRTTEWVAPYFTYIATGPHESRLFKGWLPIDDHSCYTFYIHYNPHTALNLPAIYANWGHRTELPHYRTAHTLANKHLQDRRKMATSNFSGVDGAAIQDRAVQESMGPVYDRTKEHLGTSDKAVIYWRRLILKKLEEMDAGKPLPAHDPALDFQHRTGSWYMPAEADWHTVLDYQERYERENPEAAAA